METTSSREGAGGKTDPAEIVFSCYRVSQWEIEKAQLVWGRGGDSNGDLQKY